MTALDTALQKLQTDYATLGSDIAALASAIAAEEAAAGGGLPVPLLGMYLDNNGAGPSITFVRTNHPQFNHLTYVEATGDVNANLTLDLTAAAGEDLATAIAAWKSSTDAKGNHRTITFLIADGGTPGGGSANFLNSTQATNAFNSIVGIVDAYGFDGIEWDLEGAENGTWNQATIESINSQLKTRYGSSFIIGQSPRPFELHAGMTKRGWTATHDYSAIQYYFGVDFGADFTCSNIECLEGGTTCTGNGTVNYSEGLSQFVNGSDGGTAVDASKIIFAQYVTGGSQSGCAPSQYQAAWSNLAASYPALRGAMVWRSGIEQGNGWTFASTFGTAMGL